MKYVEPIGGVRISENGPFKIDRQDPSKVVYNPLNWATIANMLFLESPIGAIWRTVKKVVAKTDAEIDRQ